MKDCETTGLGLEDRGSHWRILSTTRQGHFWEGNLAARRDELQAEKLETGEGIAAPGESSYRKPGLDHRPRGRSTSELPFHPFKGKFPPSGGRGDEGVPLLRLGDMQSPAS